MTTPNRPPATARLGFILSVAAVSAIILGAALAYLGIVAPMQGFFLFATALPLALLGILFGALGAFFTRSSTGRSGASRSWFAIISGLLILLIVGGLAKTASSAPPIHDITTDFDDPPVFVALAEVPANLGVDLAYPHGNPETAELQRQTSPNLSSLHLQRNPELALSQIEQIASNLGWKLAGLGHTMSDPTGLNPIEQAKELATEAIADDVAASNTDTNTDSGEKTDTNPTASNTHIEIVFEATATSGLFKFVDDIVVRIRGPINPDDARATIDIRSKSRDGESDLGVNVQRIREFQAALREASS